MLYDPQTPKANRRKENHHEEITKKYGSFSTFADRPISINRILHVEIYKVFDYFWERGYVIDRENLLKYP